ncbi:Ubiquitin-protein ligase [Ceratobasidium theobromae]|uniref:Ubiquitin-protein ligase n=1 Tax=Ceratobasidium theobromae TaxID=1582974 RepID=A0A5N5QLR1_9AGAM|nr:Ubiquitin-protein ligase [Ceratobasidium theobromae]
MDLQNELSHLQSVTDITGKIARNSAAKKSKSKAPAPPIELSLDALLLQMYDLRQKLDVDGEPGNVTDDDFKSLAKAIEERRKDIDERQKEVYASLTRMGKLLDKKFTMPLPDTGPLFTSETAMEALERTIAMHFFRTGSFNVAHTFMEESCMDAPPAYHTQFVDMHRILTALSANNFEPALIWCASNRDFLISRQSTLEFALHRAQFLALLLSPTDPNARQTAIAYSRQHFPALYAEHGPAVRRLLACVLFAQPGLAGSPYADLIQGPDAASLFAREYCARLGLGEQVPMKVAIDIGGSGALARIEKGRKIMKDSRTEWSSVDELPVSNLPGFWPTGSDLVYQIEIPLPPQHRYHSVFACPVSKEQASDVNPAMMLECGHVVARESLSRLTKGAAK